MVLAVSVVVLLVLSLFSIGLSFSPSSSSSSSSSYGNRLIALTNRSYKTKQIASSSLLSSLSSPPSTSISSSSISEDDAEENVIKISDKAREHLKALTLKQGGNTMCLRMGVRAGGCSGMSYVMDFVSENDITTDDHIEEYDGVKCVSNDNVMTTIITNITSTLFTIVGGRPEIADVPLWIATRLL